MRTTSALTDLAGRLRRATTALDSRARAERGGELSLTQVSVLGRILTQGPITPGELGQQLRMLPQSLTRPLASLETLGYVRRTPDPTDGRGALLEATAAGRASMQAEMRPRTAWIASAVAATCDEEDLRVLARAADIMQRLVDFGGGVAPREFSG